MTKIKEGSLRRTAAGLPQYPAPSHLYNPCLPSVCSHTPDQEKITVSLQNVLDERKKDECCSSWKMDAVWIVDLCCQVMEALRLNCAKHSFSRINSSSRFSKTTMPQVVYHVASSLSFSHTESHHSHDSWIPDTELLDES